MSGLPHIAPLRDVGSTTPTVRHARPVVAAPSGWTSSLGYDGSESWTWVDGELPLVRVLVSSAGAAPAHVSHPLTYRMSLAQMERAGAALAELCRHLGARGSR